MKSTGQQAPKIAGLDGRERFWGVTPVDGMASIALPWTQSLLLHNAKEISKARAVRKQNEQERIESDARQHWNNAV